MLFFNKIWRFLVNSGIVLFIYLLMFIGSVSLVSLTQKGSVYYGNRCTSSLDKRAITYLNQQEIIAYDYEFNCNTLYLDLSIEEDLNRNQITSLLVRISSYYKDINFNTDTQITIKNSKYIVLANIVNFEVSLSISEL